MFILIIVQTAAGENGDVIEEKHDKRKELDGKTV